MEVMNIKNKKLFIDVLNNFSRISKYIIVDEGSSSISVRNADLDGRNQAIVDFTDFVWNRSFQLNDVTKLTNAMVSLQDSDMILKDDNIVIKKGSTEYNIRYSEYFKDLSNIKKYKLTDGLDKLCTKENLVYEFLITNDELNTIRQSEKILMFKDKHVIVIGDGGEFNSRCIEQDKLIGYMDSFKLTPATIRYNNLKSCEEYLIIELSDLLFLPKYDYDVKVYTYFRTSHGRTTRCYTLEVTHTDDVMNLKYYINVSSFIKKG